MLAKCNLKLAENLAKRLTEYYDEERELVESNTMLVKCNFKLAERLAEHHDDDEERELV